MGSGKSSRNSIINMKSGLRRWTIPVSLVVLIIALAVMSLLLGGCSGGRAVTLGENNIGTITNSDPKEGDSDSGRWSYHEYVLDVEEGYPYKFTITTTSGDTTGIWSTDKGSWIVEVSPVVKTRTATYRFEEGGKQKLYIESPTDDLPADYSWHVTR
ncbi:hypothetical protein ACFLYQ_06885 [Chloroflexota bacterium]